jgi:hypothetical protein
MLDGIFQSLDGRLDVQHHGADRVAATKICTDDIANGIAVLLE